MSETAAPRRRSRTGGETKSDAKAIALELFIERGYERTSMREIAEALGVSKPALYYHFANKEAIVLALLEDRGNEAQELAAWARAQPPGADLLREGVMRWIDSFAVGKLRGIRFLNANPLLMRSLGGSHGAEIGRSLQEVAAIAAGAGASPRRLLLTRMAMLAINHAVSAAAGTDLTNEEILASARAAAAGMLDQASTL